MLQVAGVAFSLRSCSRSSGEVQRQRAVSGYYYVELSSFCITTIWEGAGALLKASLAMGSLGYQKPGRRSLQLHRTSMRWTGDVPRVANDQTGSPQIAMC